VDELKSLNTNMAFLSQKSKRGVHIG